MVRATASVGFVAVVRLLSHMRPVRINSVSIPVVAVWVVPIPIVHSYAAQDSPCLIVRSMPTSQLSLALLCCPPRRGAPESRLRPGPRRHAGQNPHVLRVAQSTGRRNRPGMDGGA